jgi:hypothetical protein
MTTQNRALGRVTVPSVNGPESRHRIAPKENTDTTASTAPNSSRWSEVREGLFGSAPTPAVKMSMSCWMRWSGLSIGLRENWLRK